MRGRRTRFFSLGCSLRFGAAGRIREPDSASRRFLPLYPVSKKSLSGAVVRVQYCKLLLLQLGRSNPTRLKVDSAFYPSEDRKQHYKLVMEEQDFQKQAASLRQKKEEAAAANKRLRDALHKHQVARKRKGIHYQGLAAISSQVKKWLDNEVEVLVSVEEAQHHLDQLLGDRKTLTEEITLLKEKQEAGEDLPSKYKRRIPSSRSLENNHSISKQIDMLQTEMESRTSQIADLQQTLMDAGTSDLTEERWMNITTIAEMKCAISYLIRELVISKIENGKIESNLQQSKNSCTDIHELLQKTWKEVAKTEAELKRHLLQVQHENQEKTLYLLKDINQQNKDYKGLETTPIPEKVKWIEERVRFQDEQLEKMVETLQGYHEALDSLEQAASKEKTPEVSNLENLPSCSFEYIPPQPEEMISGKGKNAMTTMDSEKSEEKKKKPKGKRKKMKWVQVKGVHPKNMLGCTCQSGCKYKQCGCQKKAEACTENCWCKPTTCHNREKEENLIDFSDDVQVQTQSLQESTQVAGGDPFFEPPAATPTGQVLEESMEEEVFEPPQASIPPSFSPPGPSGEAMPECRKRSQPSNLSSSDST